MAGLDYYLRLLVQADKQAVVTPITLRSASGGTRLDSQITANTRKGLAIYNNSDAASGEAYFDFQAFNHVTPAGEIPVQGMPIPKGSLWDLPLASGEAIPIYLDCVSGEIMDLRVIEYA